MQLSHTLCLAASFIVGSARAQVPSTTSRVNGTPVIQVAIPAATQTPNALNIVPVYAASVVFARPNATILQVNCGLCHPSEPANITVYPSSVIAHGWQFVTKVYESKVVYQSKNMTVDFSTTYSGTWTEDITCAFSQGNAACTGKLGTDLPGYSEESIATISTTINDFTKSMMYPVTITAGFEKLNSGGRPELSFAAVGLAALLVAVFLLL